jgi:pyruvate dehydrogenase E2 component (dihydrolipoamide acetyltransferase)
MPIEITMPQLSDTMTEGTLIKWNKKEGDKVREGEEIADVETDKATMPTEASGAGTLAVILVQTGEKVKVGAPIAVIATTSEDPAEVKRQAMAKTGAPTAPAAAAAAKPASTTTAASAAAPQSPASRPPPRGAVTATMEEANSGEFHDLHNRLHGVTRGAVPESTTPPGNGHGLKVSPLAKRIAADKGVDLTTIKGSGPGGRIIERDVMESASRPKAAPAPVATAGKPAAVKDTGIRSAIRIAPGKTEVVPLSKMRAAIAKNLVASKQSIPHFYETIDADIEELSRLRGRLNEILAPRQIRLSLGDLILKPLAAALLRHPELNATFNGTEITRYGDVHIRMAVALPDGLIVPVLRNVNFMGLVEIHQQTADLVERARAQRLKADELRGATFAVSNLGGYGIQEFSAIINPPEVAILAIATAEKRPVVKGDAIVARTMLKLTLSADHRVVDGATAAEFMRTLKGMLEEPGTILL